MSTNEEIKTSVTRSSRRAGRLSKAKKAAIVALAVSSVVIAFIAVISFIPSGSDGFVIRLDSDTSHAHFTMLDGATGSSAKTILRGTPLTNGWPVRTADVNSHYDEIASGEEGLNGSQNMADEGGHDIALMYTFYLRNDSKEEAAIFSLTSEVTNLVAPSADNASSLLDIVRILLIQSYVPVNGEEVQEDFRCYYANKSKSGTYIDGVQNDADRRECVSNYNVEKVYDEDDIFLGSYRTPAYYDQGNGFKSEEDRGLCHIFETERESNLLFSVKSDIEPGRTRRVTYIAYLEDKDPESGGAVPKDSSIGFNLTVGA